MEVLLRKICRFDARHRLFAAVATAALIFVALTFAKASFPTRVISAWDSFSATMLALTWFTIIQAEAHHIRQKARTQDLSRTVIFVFTIIAACASLFAVIFLLSTGRNRPHLPLHAALSIFAVVSGWALMHTVFALRYAHVYYGDSDNPDIHAGGLNFPDDNAPDYLDFAYFAFIIGMTCQVSDVAISSKPLRRLALLQGVLSFGFNTVILALTINIISGLL